MPPKRHVFGSGQLESLVGGMPGADSRIWVAYGTIMLDEDIEGEDNRALTFDEDIGPLVEVKLHPYDQVVTCRVATGVSGVFQSEWEPLVGGDEVIVVCPEGSEQGPPCILGRLNNGIDLFPDKVGGKDAKANNLSFRRLQAPHVTESGGMYMIRSSLTGAMIGIDETGNVTVRDGESTGLQFGPSGFAVQDADGTGQIVLNTEEGYASVWWGTTLLKMDGTDLNIAASGNVNVGSAGNTPVLHDMAVEQVINFFINYLSALSLAIAAIPTNPLTPSALALVFDPTLAGAVPVNAGIAGASSNAHPALSAYMGAVTAALQGAAPITPLTPGLACPGFIIS